MTECDFRLVFQTRISKNKKQTKEKKYSEIDILRHVEYAVLHKKES